MKLRNGHFKDKLDALCDSLAIVVAIVTAISLYVIFKDPFGISELGKILRPVSSLILRLSGVFN
ncbi:MAG: hypothetical protein QXM53_02530 [Thermofilaceae archaeon]